MLKTHAEDHGVDCDEGNVAEAYHCLTAFPLPTSVLLWIVLLLHKALKALKPT